MRLVAVCAALLLVQACADSAETLRAAIASGYTFVELAGLVRPDVEQRLPTEVKLRDQDVLTHSVHAEQTCSARSQLTQSWQLPLEQ